MKPLFTLTIYSQDPRDPATATPIGTVAFDYPGNAQLYLSRNEVGQIMMPEGPVFKADERFVDLIDQSMKDLAELHRQMVEQQCTTERVKVGMFEVHKCLTG